MSKESSRRLLVGQGDPRRFVAKTRRAEAARVLPAVLLLVGCGTQERRWPFPLTAAASDAEVVAVLGARVRGVRALYAECAMSFDFPQGSGVASSVVRYRSPGTIRMTTFKDLFVTSEDLFDLVLTPERFDLKLRTDQGLERHGGALEDLAAYNAGFRAMGALREAMFLPGLCDPGAPPQVSRTAGAIHVRTLTPTGATVEWDLEPRTLGVRRARLELKGGAATIEYPSYSVVEGRYLPERFELRDPSVQCALEGVVEELEINPDLTAEELRIDP